MAELPSYLEPRLPSQALTEPSTSPANYLDAIFRHQRVPSVAHVYWWPRKPTGPDETCFLFIPGNPGLLDWYTPFLEALYEKSRAGMSVLAHAFVGHTPSIDGSAFDPSATSLAAQVEHALEVVDALKSAGYKKIVIAGHSVGTWVSVQVLKQRPGVVDAAFLLFPTIAHIADTPNGRNYGRFFASPFPWIVSSISPLTRLIPTWLLAKTLFKDWPEAQLKVLKDLLNSPPTIHAALTMAHQEMRNIKDLDVQLLRENSHRLHLYFAEDDSWVGQNRETILHAFQYDESSVRIVHGKQDIPHAFCINHGEAIAQTCSEWLLEGNFVTE